MRWIGRSHMAKTESIITTLHIKVLLQSFRHAQNGFPERL
jgi:hypothetical protein